MLVEMGILYTNLTISKVNSMHETYATDNHFFKGLFWGSVLTVPLWLSFFGWAKLIFGYIF
jgi:hypothetical protein